MSCPMPDCVGIAFPDGPKIHIHSLSWAGSANILHCSDCEHRWLSLEIDPGLAERLRSGQVLDPPLVSVAGLTAGGEGYEDTHTQRFPPTAEAVLAESRSRIIRRMRDA